MQEETAQSLEQQNVFTLLGAESLTDEEKENFLERLNKAVWDDFLDNDVELLLTEEELVKLTDVIKKMEISDEEKQAEMEAFLMEVIPDLERILVEKALKLKKDLAWERMSGLEKMHAQDAGVLEKITQAKEKAGAEQWGETIALLAQV
ncbi:hypothetical protein FWH30_00035 [Microgenomates group bacterium]|nr:hypothetical protein [Microgenomates group bacterium]